MDEHAPVYLNGHYAVSDTRNVRQLQAPDSDVKGRSHAVPADFIHEANDIIKAVTRDPEDVLRLVVDAQNQHSATCIGEGRKLIRNRGPPRPTDFAS